MDLDWIPVEKTMAHEREALRYVRDSIKLKQQPSKAMNGTGLVRSLRCGPLPLKIDDETFTFRIPATKWWMRNTSH